MFTSFILPDHSPSSKEVMARTQGMDLEAGTEAKASKEKEIGAGT